MLVAFLDYKVRLPGGRRASQNHTFILAKGAGQLVSITVGLSGQNKELLPWLLVSRLDRGRLPLLSVSKIRTLSHLRLLERLDISPWMPSLCCQLNKTGKCMIRLMMFGKSLVLLDTNSRLLVFDGFSICIQLRSTFVQ